MKPKPNPSDPDQMPTKIQTNGRAVVGFETERLTARKLASADSAYLEKLHANPKVMATLGGVRDREESEDWLRTNLEHWNSFALGQWILDTDGTCIGRGGLRKIDECVGEDLIEVGYVIDEGYWGRGYATEATKAFIRIAASHYDLTELGAITLKDNAASTRVLEKCGFVFERWVDHRTGPHRFLRYTEPC